MKNALLLCLSGSLLVGCAAAPAQTSVHAAIASTPGELPDVPGKLLTPPKSGDIPRLDATTAVAAQRALAGNDPDARVPASVVLARMSDQQFTRPTSVPEGITNKADSPAYIVDRLAWVLRFDDVPPQNLLRGPGAAQAAPRLHDCRLFMFVDANTGDFLGSVGGCFGT